MTAQTPLYSAHLRAGAKMTNFAGWLMPLHYGSQLAEHRQVRQDSGVFDVSHMAIFDLQGPDSRSLLRRVLANDVARLDATPGRALYSCMLNPEGGILDDLIAYFLGPEQYRLVVNAATQTQDLAWLNTQATDQAVTITWRRDLAMLAVQGPKARQRLPACLPAALAEAVENLPGFHAIRHQAWMLACTGYTGEDGFEILLPAEQVQELWDALLAAGVQPIGLGARDSLRLEAGLALYGQDLDQAHSPLSSSLGWTLAWQPEDRNFIGREALLAEQASGGLSSLAGLVAQGPGMLRPGQRLWQDANCLGEILSGGFSPMLNTSIALARLPTPWPEQCEVELRDQRRLSAKIVKPPFVRRGAKSKTGTSQ